MAQEDLNPGLGEETSSPQPVELQPAQDQTPLRLKPARSPFLTRGNLALLGMYAAGIAGLYGLSLRSGPSTALADQSLVHAKVEAALSLLDAPPSAKEQELRSSAKAIVNEFYTAARQRQVDIKGLQGNPFIFKKVEPPPAEPTTKAVENPGPKPPDEHAQALAAAKMLRLQSVLVGRETTAMISYNLVTVGQTIKGWTVVRISPREVELSWKDKTYVLQMP